jgi:D-glycero-D-manno-heptose 1,7-bisphosphate phosphatase
MRLVILDRDGVINEDRDDFIKAPDEWVPIPRSLEAIARLHRAGYQVVVMTNQSGISRGLFDLNTLNRVHVRMMDYVRRHGGQIEAIFFCPHGPDDDCTCRKPRAGMYTQLADRLKSSLEGVPSVGDSMRDLEAASAAGSSPILVRTGKGRASAKILEDRNLPGLGDVPVFENLADFVEELLATESREDDRGSQRSTP